MGVRYFQQDQDLNFLVPLGIAGLAFVLVLATKHLFDTGVISSRLLHRATVLPPEFQDIVPYKGLPIYDAPKWPHFWKPGVFQMTMGLKRLDANNWLTYDTNWEREYRQKLEWVDSKYREEVVQVLPNTDASCEELLEVVVAYITNRYPDMFQLVGNEILIVPVQHRYRIKAPFDRHPMELIGLLAMDDFYVLHKGEMDLYYLRACFLACPLGWALRDRIGWPLHQIHGPVPLWREKLQKSMEKFFLNLKVEAPIQRYNGFVQPEYLLHSQKPFTKPAETINDVHIRAELQSLRRLPRTKAIIFTVRTHLNPVTVLEDDPSELETLWDAARNYVGDTGVYKVKHLWFHVFEPWCQQVLGKDRPTCSVDPEVKSAAQSNVIDASSSSAQKCPAGFN